MLTRRSIVLIPILCLAAGLGLAQIKSSAITGTVTDTSGATMPNVTVVVRNQETNISQQATTNSVGEYIVPYLGAGSYALEITAPGFQVYKKTGIVMGTATTVRSDAVLSPGSVRTTVEVRADAIALQTESSTVQGSVSQSVIANIPNINNNPLYYATLQAGVVPAAQMYNSSKLGVGFGDRQAMSAIRINGGPLGSNDVQLDGVSVQGAAWHESTVVPVRDALQEVRVATNNFSAETGNAGGVISMTTKSGTNELHGVLNYRLRNEALNANGFYNNFYGVRRGKYRVNEGSASVGGPIVIPKLVNGKDKLFFFASFSRLSHSDPVSLLTRVPTELERMGDFSQTNVADNSGNPVPVQIYNPFSSRPYQGSTTTFERQPYPNAVITGADQYGLKILQAYPKPNATPTDAFGNNNYSFTGTAPTVRNNLNTRLDYRLSDNNSLYLTGGLSSGSIASPNMWGADSKFANMNWPGIISDDTPYAAAGDTITLNPTTVLDIRYGVTRVRTRSSYPDGGAFDYSEYGMPAAVQALVAVSGAAPSIGNFGGPIANLNMDGWARKKEFQTNHTLNGSVTKMRGRWTHKAGAEYRVYLGNWQDLVNATPVLNGSNTTGWLADVSGNNSSLITNPAQRGISFASVLTGDLGWSLTKGATLAPALASKYTAFFSQNDWRATDKLTLNFGLRCEVQPGPTERYNHASSLDLEQFNPYMSSVTLANSMAGLGKIAFPGVDGYSRNLWDTQWNNISPRLGAAYQMGAFVLRGGFGRTYLPSNTGFNANGLVYGTGPFSGGAQSNAYGLAPNGVPVGRFEDAQNTLILPANGAVQSPSIYGNANAQMWVDTFKRNFKNGHVDQWNFFIERRVNSWLLSVGYVGSHGANLPWRIFPINGAFMVPDTQLSAWRNAWYASNGTDDPASYRLPNPMTSLIGVAPGASGGATLSAVDALQPYAALLGATVLEDKGLTNYNALQFRAQHAYSNGLEMSLNYSWSKSTGRSGGTAGSSYAESQIANGSNYVGGNDYRNLDNNRGLQSFDIPHRFVGVLSYQLPTGKGRILDPGSRVLRGLVGDWVLGSVVTLQSGEPWGPNCGGMNGRCLVDSSEPLELPTELQHWYDGRTTVTLPSGRRITPANGTFLKWNPDHFKQPIVQFPNGQYQVDQYFWGVTSQYVNGLRLPGLQNVNLTLNRKFRLRERTQLEFLAEATNLFNATTFQPNAVNPWMGSVLNADANTRVGQNSNVNFGSLGTRFYQPRQITLSLRLQF